MMANRRQALGARGEALAQEHLEHKGYRLVGRNVRTDYGEIDLVMKDGNALVFVEVKTRRTAAYGPPEEAITEAKYARMAASAEAFMQTWPEEETPWRLDVVAVAFTGGVADPELRHLKNVRL